VAFIGTAHAGEGYDEKAICVQDEGKDA